MVSPSFQILQEGHGSPRGDAEETTWWFHRPAGVEEARQGKKEDEKETGVVKEIGVDVVDVDNTEHIGDTHG